MKNYKTALKGIIGENLVTAELASRYISKCSQRA